MNSCCKFFYSYFSQVHYGNGAGGDVSILPPGYTSGAAAPLPEKGPMPPPYTMGGPVGDNAGVPYGGAPASVAAPPAYSDITVAQPRVHGGPNGAPSVASASGRSGYDNPAYDNPAMVRGDEGGAAGGGGSTYEHSVMSDKKY